MVSSSPLEGDNGKEKKKNQTKTKKEGVRVGLGVQIKPGPAHCRLNTETTETTESIREYTRREYPGITTSGYWILDPGYSLSFGGS